MPKQPQENQGGVRISGGRISVGGDVIGRDKITTSAAQGTPLKGAFQEIIQAIDSRPDDPNVDKAELKDVVTKIEAEAQKGQAANANKVERWLLFLASMADDIFQVTVNTLANPVLGVAKAIQLIAQKARDQAQKAGQP